MKKKNIQNNIRKGSDKTRLVVIAIICVLVIVTGGMFAYGSFRNEEVAGGVLGIAIALIILGFAFIVLRRGNRDLREGYPLKDERSKKVMEKASSLAFYVSLYLLLAVGFLSEDVIKFRDVSQAASISVGGMALLFLVFWIYYNRKEI